MFTIISVYNKRQILENFLLKSLEEQTSNYQLLLIDNRAGKFPSAASAFNSVTEKIEGDYIIFAHQDVKLEDSNWLERAEKILSDLENPGVVGVAGKTFLGRFFGSVYQGENRKFCCKRHTQKSTIVQTVDECLFIIPAEIFKKIKFDEQTCNGWHLYAVDYSLTLLEHGFRNYVIALPVHHYSPGYSFNEEYFEILGKVLRKHKRQFLKINTTIGIWYPFLPLWANKKIFQIRQIITSIKKNS